MKRWLGIVLAVLFLMAPMSAEAANYMWWATGLTGGSNALDGIDGASLTDGDGALCVIDDSGTIKAYFYRLEDFAAAPPDESPPSVITPDANPGNKRWELIENLYVMTSFSTAGGEPHYIIVSNTSDPGSPAEGWIWYNSTANEVKVYNGSNTQTFILKDHDHNIWQAIYVDAAALTPDGTICLAAAEQTLNSGPKTYVVDCSSDAAGTFEFKVGMPENWDGGSIIIEPIVISDEATPAGTIEFDMSIQARGNDELVDNTWVTTNGEVYFEDAETANTTVDTQWKKFKCKNKTAMAAAGAGGDTLYVKGTRDNDDATHDTSTQGVWLQGVKVYYQTDDMDEKD